MVLAAGPSPPARAFRIRRVSFSSHSLRTRFVALVCAGITGLTGVAARAQSTPTPAPSADEPATVNTAPVVREPLPARTLKPGERRRRSQTAPSAQRPPTDAASQQGAARFEPVTPDAPTGSPTAAPSGLPPNSPMSRPSAAPPASVNTPDGNRPGDEPTQAAPAAGKPADGRAAAVDAQPPPAAESAPTDDAAAQPSSTRRVAARRDFTFTLDAPDGVSELLQLHLDMAQRDYEEDGIDRDRLDTLIERAERQARGLLSTEGYFTPKLDTRVEGSTKPWRVTMHVDTGDATNISEVSIRIVGEHEAIAQRFYDDRKIAANWTLRTGERFREESWDRSKDALLRAFLVEEFPEARYARTEARIDPATRAASLVVELDSGPPRYFGESHITGLHDYPPSVIEIQNRIRPGAPYSQVALLETQSRLQVLPYFRNVTVTADLDAADAEGRVPVEIAVEEAQTKKFLIGPGFSSNTGARIQAGYTDVNINGRGWRLDSLVRAEQREQLARATITLPDRADGYRDSIGTTFIHSDVEGLEVRSSNLLLRHGRDEQSLRNIDRAYTLLYAYSIEKPSGVDRRINRALAPGISWTYRRIDNLAYPREGVIANLQLAGGTRLLLSDEDFIRTYGKLVGFLPLGRRDSVTARLEGGAVLTARPDNVPESLRFRAGGDQSIRGYAYQSIGQTEGTATVGARYLAIGGIELTHWVGEQWGVGVFGETGDAFNTVAEFKPHTGVGLGPRWRSPIGPLNFDLAYGTRSHQIRLHFSLGFVF